MESKKTDSSKETKLHKELDSLKEYLRTKKGRRFMREKRYLQALSDRERRAYEECMALVQALGQNSSHEDVCRWLEKYTMDETEG